MKYLLILLVFFAACYFEENKQEITQDLHSWRNYHWASNAFPLEYDNNTRTGDWDNALMGALCDWNHLNSPLVIEEVSTEGARISIEQRHSTQWLGLAQIYISGGHIVKGKVTMNPVLLTDSRYTPEAAQHVLCQELGHVFGLTHIVGDTCMDDCAGSSTKEEWLVCINDPAKVGPNTHDEEQLNIIYAHNDFVDASVPDAGLVDAGTSGDPPAPGCSKGKSPKCDQGWITVHTLEMF